MTTMTNHVERSRARGRAVLVTLWAALLALSLAFASRPEIGGLVFVVLGATALTLAAFTTADGADALRLARPSAALPSAPAALFWEAFARNCWLSGVLGSLLYFVLALCDPSTSISEVATRMALAFVPAVYGLGLALLSVVPAVKLRYVLPGQPSAAGDERPGEDETAGGRGLAGEQLLGYVLFAVLLAATVGWRYVPLREPRFTVWSWLASWPAVVVVLLALFAAAAVGAPARGRVWTPAFAAGGLLGSLAGLVQVMVGFAARSLSELTSGIAFVVSSCFIALLGIAAVAAPREDRAARADACEHPWLFRAIWALFPAVALILLVITFVLVITPMTAQAK